MPTNHVAKCARKSWDIEEENASNYQPKLRTQGLKPHYFPWAEAQLRTFGLKPNYELLG
ncbi:MAG: hypothetical protein MUC60_13315 [Oscillatoria sp. Prado101]|nr:hypothetical protein [Oscillatoria sp. Prado101]